VLAQASAVGVTHILSVGTDLRSSAECVRLAARFPGVFAAVGIHPHDAAEFGPSALVELRRLASQPNVVAIGEIGLDNVRATVPPPLQEIAFTQQVSLAAELGLPIVVHNREADVDVLRIIASVNRSPTLAERAGVLHCFSGGLEFARSAHAAGFFIGFAGNLTYRRSVELRAVVAEVPLTWLLTETDSPYLSPEPLRGKTNQPANVAFVARQIASARGASLDDIASETSANATSLFGWN
jgi:TatD DNase family protein